MTGSVSGNAELRPGCYVGGPGAGGVCCGVWSACVVWAAAVSSVWFLAIFSLETGHCIVCMVFGSDFTYKLCQLYSIYSSSEYRPP